MHAGITAQNRRAGKLWSLLCQTDTLLHRYGQYNSIILMSAMPQNNRTSLLSSLLCIGAQISLQCRVLLLQIEESLWLLPACAMFAVQCAVPAVTYKRTGSAETCMHEPLGGV